MCRLERAWARYGDGDIRKFAYILATAYLETAFRMEPITEYGSREYLRAKKYYPYIGRGFVQLTWEINYRDWSKRLGIDLVKTPDLALDPEISARIIVEGMMLGTFTTKKLRDYINADRCDFVDARRIVNGKDKANVIANYAAKFLFALQADAIVNAIPPPPDIEPIDPPKPAPGLFAIIAGFLANFLKGRRG
jgi:hypothetical protein